LQRAEAAMLGARALVHVEPLVDLELQTVTSTARIAIGAHQLSTLERVVDLHGVAHAGQHLSREFGERRIAARAVSIAEHEVGARPAGAALALSARNGVHRMAVDVKAEAKARVSRGDALLKRTVIWRVAAFDARAHLLHGELALIDRLTVVERAPDERLADVGLAAGLMLEWPVPAFDEREVDIGVVTVRVDVGSRRLRCQQPHASLGGGQQQLVDEAVLAIAQRVLADSGTEVGRTDAPTVRRIEQQRLQHLGRTMDDEWLARVDHFGRLRWRLDSQAAILAEDIASPAAPPLRLILICAVTSPPSSWKAQFRRPSHGRKLESTGLSGRFRQLRSSSKWVIGQHVKSAFSASTCGRLVVSTTVSGIMISIGCACGAILR